MSNIKKVLCVKAKNEHDRIFTRGKIYDVDVDGWCGCVKDETGRSTYIIFDTPCVYGEWQPLEEYVCMSGIYSELKIFDTFFGYLYDGMILSPLGDGTNRIFVITENFKKVSDMITFRETRSRFEVRHVVYDAKENKVANDAMGECYITLAEAQEVCDEMNEPKVMKPKYTKEVEYFGIKIMVPDNTKYLATNGIGSVHASNKELTISNIHDHWCTTGTGNLSFITKADLNGIDWKDTLVEIK